MNKANWICCKCQEICGCPYCSKKKLSELSEIKKDINECELYAQQNQKEVEELQKVSQVVETKKVTKTKKPVKHAISSPEKSINEDRICVKEIAPPPQIIQNKEKEKNENPPKVEDHNEHNEIQKEENKILTSNCKIQVTPSLQNQPISGPVNSQITYSICPLNYFPGNFFSNQYLFYLNPNRFNMYPLNPYNQSLSNNFYIRPSTIQFPK